MFQNIFEELCPLLNFFVTQHMQLFIWLLHLTVLYLVKYVLYLVLLGLLYSAQLGVKVEFLKVTQAVAW
jgi:hypothetical protein